MDVLARKGGEAVAIDAETGQSDVVANVRHCLRAKIDRAIVVATDEAALGKVERELATAELLIGAKVEVVLREPFELDSTLNGCRGS